MSEIEKIDLKSLDIKQKKLEELRAILPQAFSDGKFSLESLKHELGEMITEQPLKERFGLNWSGKAHCMEIVRQASIGTLLPEKDESENFESSQNIIIEGENLEVLKLLQKSYYGKIKVIYIDPPYNTGNEFIYPDNFKEGLTEYLLRTNQLDGNGFKLSTQADKGGRFHTNWLNMIYPRLYLSRNLLKDDGVILISINDIEVANLRLVMNEIFGEENFLCQFVWNNDGNIDQQSKIKGVHEYILAYIKNIDRFKTPSVIDPNIDESSKLFNNQIENSITKNGSANPVSKILLPVGFPANFQHGSIEIRLDKFPYIHSKISVNNFILDKETILESGWSSKNLLELFINNGCQPICDSEGKETTFALTSTGAIYVYKKRSENQGHVISVIRNVGTTKQNSNMLATWGINFSYPKPVYLNQYLIDIFTEKNSNDIILDFFAGSGTTGHATVRSNLSDCGNRKFILNQIPELTNSSNYPTIAALTRKRISASIENELKKTGTLLVNNSLLGYKAFRLASSNFSLWNSDIQSVEELVNNLQLFKDNIVDGRSSEDIVFELLLKSGFELTEKITKLQIAQKEVFSIQDHVLLICLDRNLTMEVIEGMLQLKPFQIICLDVGFNGNDQLKVNVIQTIKSQHENEDTKTIFRVV